MEKVELLSLPFEKWGEEIAALGEPKYRAKQLQNWVFQQYKMDYLEMINIPISLKSQLQEKFQILNLRVEDKQISEDGTVKWALKTEDGHFLECVLIRDSERNSICLSSQLGCAMGCEFCNTAKMGLIRNLSLGEILGQFLIVGSYLKESGERLTNAIFMGMGEPLQNGEVVRKACRILSDDNGFGLSKKRITVSTSGLIPEILKWAEKAPEFKLAISLNGSNNMVRQELMPINKRYPIEELIKAAYQYGKTTGQRITFEYVLIPGKTCTSQAAKELKSIASRLDCKINLIPFNPGGTGGFNSPDEKEVEEFKRLLSDGHFPVMVRKPKGRDISAACGQLVKNRKKVA